MLSSTFLRWVATVAMVALVIAPAPVYSGDGGDCANSSDDPESGVTADTPDEGGNFAAGPGGGAGGTIGSLPTVITPASNWPSGYLPPPGSSSTSLITTLSIPYKAAPASFGWIANGSYYGGGSMSPSSPSLSFFTKELKASQSSFGSLVLVFANGSGAITAAIDVKSLKL